MWKYGIMWNTQQASIPTIESIVIKKALQNQDTCPKNNATAMVEIDQYGSMPKTKHGITTVPQ